MRLLGPFAALLLAGCSEETSIIFSLRFDETLRPGAVGQIVFVVEPEDGSGLPGVSASEGDSDVRWKVSDQDGDGDLEAAFWVTETDMHFAADVRLRKHPSPPALPVGEWLRFVAVVADRNGVQIGGGEVTAKFIRDEEDVVQFPLACNCAGGVGCRGDGGVECPERPERFCGDEVDGDGDGLVDCGDSECHALADCASCEVEDCTTPDIDESCDGRPACTDPTCLQHPACREGCGLVEICDGLGFDEDCNQHADCGDGACLDEALCDCNPAWDEICDNGVDDDCDGRTDQRDCSCEGHPTSEDRCDNGTDDDCDGATDCEDVLCADAPGCFCSEREAICGDRWNGDCDPDGQGDRDCEDPDCEGRGGSFEDNSVSCGDFADNDLDCAVDCEDHDCQKAGATGRLPEICGNGRDDDCDGDDDCLDDDCPTTEVNCLDRYDDDCDTRVDCQDTDCDSISACQT